MSHVMKELTFLQPDSGSFAASKIGCLQFKDLKRSDPPATALLYAAPAEAAPREKLDERFEALLARIACVPVNQLIMQKLAINQTLSAQGLGNAQTLSVILDGIARHTPEGYAFARRAAAAGFKQAVRERDEPFGDAGPSTYRGE